MESATGVPIAAAALFDTKLVSRPRKIITEASTSCGVRLPATDMNALPIRSAPPVSVSARPSAMLATTTSTTSALMPRPSPSNLRQPVTISASTPSSEEIAIGSTLKAASATARGHDQHRKRRLARPRQVERAVEHEHAGFVLERRDPRRRALHQQHVARAQHAVRDLAVERGFVGRPVHREDDHAEAIGETDVLEPAVMQGRLLRDHDFDQLLLGCAVRVLLRRQIADAPRVVQRGAERALVVLEVGGGVADEQPVALGDFEILGRGKSLVAAQDTVESPSGCRSCGATLLTVLPRAALRGPMIQHGVESPRRDLRERALTLAQQARRDEPEIERAPAGPVRRPAA